MCVAPPFATQRHTTTTPTSPAKSNIKLHPADFTPQGALIKYYLIFFCFSLSVNYSQCNHCAAADEEKCDPEEHITVISGLRTVGISRLIEFCQSCLGIVEYFLCILVYKRFLVVGECIVGIVSRLDSRLIVLLDGVRLAHYNYTLRFRSCGLSRGD